MKVIYEYYKNSNTGDLIKSQTFICESIKNIPVNWYVNSMYIEGNLKLPKGYVKINEKKYKRELKRLNIK